MLSASTSLLKAADTCLPKGSQVTVESMQGSSPSCALCGGPWGLPRTTTLLSVPITKLWPQLFT